MLSAELRPKLIRKYFKKCQACCRILLRRDEMKVHSAMEACHTAVTRWLTGISAEELTTP
jgi:hypothetical protein